VGIYLVGDVVNDLGCLKVWVGKNRVSGAAMTSIAVERRNANVKIVLWLIEKQRRSILPVGGDQVVHKLLFWVGCTDPPWHVVGKVPFLFWVWADWVNDGERNGVPVGDNGCVVVGSPKVGVIRVVFRQLRCWEPHHTRNARGARDTILDEFVDGGTRNTVPCLDKQRSVAVNAPGLDGGHGQ